MGPHQNRQPRRGLVAASRGQPCLLLAMTRSHDSLFGVFQAWPRPPSATGQLRIPHHDTTTTLTQARASRAGASELGGPSGRSVFVPLQDIICWADLRVTNKIQGPRNRTVSACSIRQIGQMRPKGTPKGVELACAAWPTKGWMDPKKGPDPFWAGRSSVWEERCSKTSHQLPSAGRAASGSFTTRAFAVNFGHERADIHHEHNVLSVPTALWKMRFEQSRPMLARRRVDIDVNFLHEPFCKTSNHAVRWRIPAETMRDDKRLKGRWSLSETALT